ncbi:MAG: UV DNA damage repair endonuclease UvsE [Kiritimatiellae bacterium]|nr:UV DNA damage repair endonuclease UvsE [Kiritimatiellia bacterium]
MIRLGLCCLFSEEPIRFRVTTVKALSSLTQTEQHEKLSSLCRHNAEALQQALRYCAEHHIGAFRVNSRILPCCTHPRVGYHLTDLPEGHAIKNLFLKCGDYVRKHHLRTSFHPDQFVILNSPRPEVVKSSLAELTYQAEVAEWIGADVINLHGGGVYGDKTTALQALRRTIDLLPPAIRSRLTLENDDRSYTPADLLPVCRDMGVPLVYDVHHHRCLPDGGSIRKTTQMALSSWEKREPHFHLSSPLTAWTKSGNHRPHHDYIDVADFPDEWRNLSLTVDIEAKAKELAIARLRKDLIRRDWSLWPAHD